ncbi:arylsulfotransferase family protein [Zhihengliuella halotolerans]|uniref:arylsulfotransferase family protein n=1 Tax=Zhihengliuella halotolerans TaxID=370736 RepID=UPI0015E085AD|nr:arylsulfotransferase family protein [Zhihengliuella halotolerans]
MASLASCRPADGADDEDKLPVPHQSFVTRPDLAPPEVSITRHGDGASEHHVFLTPKFRTDTPVDGAVIVAADGQLVWMRAVDGDEPGNNLFDLRVQEYLGEPVLTMYEGTNERGRGNGEVLILDETYTEIARVTTGGSLPPGHADFHDTAITGDGTMLIAAYEPVPADLSSVGGPADAYAEDAVIQEIDIATGEVRFEWSALDHVPVAETMVDFQEKKAELEEEAEEAEKDEEFNELGTEEKPFDYFHINSVTEDGDGALLVSARHTNAVYKLDRDTGRVVWTLGGSASDFELGEGAEFTWQHDAQRSADGTLTLLDNHAHGADDDESSRGLRLALDESAMTAEVVTEYLPPEERIAGSQANAQELPGGNMLIGWGQKPFYSEYTRDGEILYDACHGDACRGEEFGGGGASYRAYTFEWEGRPAAPPDVVVQDDDERTAYVSWNGATEVAQWRLLAGEDESGATEAAVVDRESFETAIPVPEGALYVSVEALGVDGEVLGTATPDG